MVEYGIIGALAILLAFVAILACRLGARLDATERELREADRDRHSLWLAEKIGGVGTWMIDCRSEHVYWSPKVFEIHGRSPDRCPPPLAQAIDYYHPMDRAAVSEAVGKAMREGTSFHFKARLIAEDGSQKMVTARAASQCDPAGTIEFIFGVFIETGAAIEIADFQNDNFDPNAFLNR